jgi:hypothetical protein
MVFDPNSHMMQIKNRQGSSDYLPVQWRLVWFREACPQGEIETELITLDLDRETEEEGYVWNNDTRRSEKVIKRANGYALFKATVRDGKGGIATGYKSEKAASFSEFAEKAETGAVGRALAMLGYGTQFAPELNEEHRIVDAPVDRNTPSTDGNGYGRKPLASVRPPVPANTGKTNGAATEEHASDALATEQQLNSIRKLCQHLGKPEPENPDTLSYLDAKGLITQLSHEYNEQKQQRKAS